MEGKIKNTRNITKYKKVKALNNLDYKGQKCISQGKIYPVVKGGWKYITIIDDTGQELQLYHDNISFNYLS